MSITIKNQEPNFSECLGNQVENNKQKTTTKIKHSGILYLKVNYVLRDKIKSEIEYYIRNKTAPNKERLVEQKKISKDFGFHLTIKDIWYPDVDDVMRDLLVLELRNELTEENYSAFYFSIRTLEGVFQIIGTKEPIDKGAMTAKTKYHTKPTYISKGEFKDKVVLNRNSQLASGTKVYLPKYNSIGEIMYFDKGAYNISVNTSTGKKVIPCNLKDFFVIGSLHEKVSLLGSSGKITQVTISKIDRKVITCSTKSNKKVNIALNDFLSWKVG